MLFRSVNCNTLNSKNLSFEAKREAADNSLVGSVYAQIIIQKKRICFFRRLKHGLDFHMNMPSIFDGQTKICPGQTAQLVVATRDALHRNAYWLLIRL